MAPDQTPSSRAPKVALFSSTPDQIPCSHTLSPSTPIPICPLTPRSALRSAVVATLKPNPSKSTLKALKQGRKGRKRVQKKIWECLTKEESVKRPKLEEEERAKKAKKDAVKRKVKKIVRKSKNTKAVPKKKRKVLALSSDSEEEDCPIVDSDNLSEEDSIVLIEVGSYYLVKIGTAPKALYTG